MKLGQIFISLSISMSLCAQLLSAQTDEFPVLSCTADFGILMNDAGDCSTYTNGCQRADLIATGYKQQCDIVYLNDPYFEIDDTKTYLPEYLPTINNIRITRTTQKLSCEFCEVEPLDVFELQFTHSACGRRVLDLEIDSNDTRKTEKNIYVIYRDYGDCDGPHVNHKYRFKWDAYNTMNDIYTVMNPTIAPY
ncbi:MAG: hypothetical protein KBD78_02275 [Oligoflexales bacterium]|nr:hypothetical protein [Oligoflexales bacterium]